MKVAIVVLALLGFAFAAPQQRKLFHEHFEDFMDVIFAEVGEELKALTEEYEQNEEFRVALDYMVTNNFKDLIYEMESLPEFRAVVEFLEKDNIDIIFFIDIINDMLENFKVNRARLQARHKNFSSYISDCISVFPKDKLAALFDQKIAEDEQFRVTMENLQSDEWKQIFGALWESETFKAEVHTLAHYGIDVGLVVQEILAVFGQN